MNNKSNYTEYIELLILHFVKININVNNFQKKSVIKFYLPHIFVLKDFTTYMLYLDLMISKIFFSF